MHGLAAVAPAALDQMAAAEVLRRDEGRELARRISDADDPLACLILQAELEGLISEKTGYLQVRALLDAWAAWEVACCEERGGHWWQLDIRPDPDDWELHVELACRHCPASPDAICEDGQEMLCGQFTVMAGYVLHLNCGTVRLNGDWRRGSADRFTYGWRGPVTAEVRANAWHDFEYGPQCDPEIMLTPLPG